LVSIASLYFPPQGAGNYTQIIIKISGYTAKTFYKSLKKLKGLNLSPVWADSLLLKTKGVN
jgi:hypothetical protein